MIRVKISNVRPAEAYCLKHIGPRLYYIHLAQGGQGWMIKRENGKYTLTIEDDKKATLALLSLSDIINETQGW